MSPSPHRLPQRLIRAVVCALGLVAAGIEVRAADGNEAQVRAAFLLNFTHFVEWPSHPGGPSTLTLCIAANAALVDAVTTLVSGHHVGGHPVLARGLRPGDAPNGCQLLYVALAREADRADLMERVRGPVLTVGDSELFLRQGGMIRLYLDDANMRFQIDQSKAEAAGLRLSAQLLRLSER